MEELALDIDNKLPAAAEALGMDIDEMAAAAAASASPLLPSEGFGAPRVPSVPRALSEAQVVRRTSVAIAGVALAVAVVACVSLVVIAAEPHGAPAAPRDVSQEFVASSIQTSMQPSTTLTSTSTSPVTLTTTTLTPSVKTSTFLGQALPLAVADAADDRASALGSKSHRSDPTAVKGNAAPAMSKAKAVLSQNPRLLFVGVVLVLAALTFACSRTRPRGFRQQANSRSFALNERVPHQHAARSFNFLDASPRECENGGNAADATATPRAEAICIQVAGPGIHEFRSLACVVAVRTVTTDAQDSKDTLAPSMHSPAAVNHLEPIAEPTIVLQKAPEGQPGSKIEDRTLVGRAARKSACCTGCCAIESDLSVIGSVGP
jgi:hypothetical protein